MAGVQTEGPYWVDEMLNRADIRIDPSDGSYGTGFGPTTPSVAPGVVSFTPAILANSVVVSIGGVTASVSFAGLSAAGLYQFNVTVPALSSGDHPVTAQVLGISTQTGVLIKTQS